MLVLDEHKKKISITHFVCKGMQDTEGLIVQLAVTKQVVNKVRPKPRISLSTADNVAHSFNRRKKKAIIDKVWTYHCLSFCDGDRAPINSLVDRLDILGI